MSLQDISTLEELIDAINEYCTTPKRPALTGLQLGVLLQKTIEILPEDLQGQVDIMKTALVVNPTYQFPLAVVSSTQTVNGLEVGQTISIPLTVSFTQRDAGAALSYEIKKNNLSIANAANYTDTEVQVSLTPIVYTGVVSYADGPVKNTNFGDAYPAGKILAGAVTSISLTYVGYYKIFFAPVASAPANSAGVRALAGQQLTSAGNTFTLNTGNTQKIFCFWLPTGKTLQSAIDQDNLNVNITSLYISSALSVNDAGGNAVAGTLYTMTNAIAYSSNHRHFITIQ